MKLIHRAPQVLNTSMCAELVNMYIYVHICTRTFELSPPPAATTPLLSASCYRNTETKLDLEGKASEKET